MANKLYNETAIQNIAAAIRQADGNTALMKVSDMPSRISKLGGISEREVWAQFTNAGVTLPIDTFPALFTHKIEVVGCNPNGFDYTCLFGGYATSFRFYGVMIRHTYESDPRLQCSWGGGNSGVTTKTYTRSTTIDTYRPLKTTISAQNVTVEQNSFKETFQVTTSSDRGNLRYAFAFGTMRVGSPCIVKEAKVYETEASTTPLWHFVFVLKSDWTFLVREKTTGYEQIINATQVYPLLDYK